MQLYFNSKFKISHYDISDRRVKRNIRLAVLADLHNCMCSDGGRMLFDAIDSRKPDLVIIAGDMIDAKKNSYPAKTMELIKLIHDNYPVIYGMGNHEKKVLEGRGLYEIKKSFKDGLRAANLKILSNSYKYIKDTGIKISCLDLPSWYFGRIEDPGLSVDQMREYLGDVDRDYYNILIAHDPQYFDTYSDYGPDLVLSGHMHGGVIRLPFLGGLVSPKLALFPKYDVGYFERKNTKMIISGGLGMHTIPLRINNPPELVIIDLWKKA